MTGGFQQALDQAASGPVGHLPDARPPGRQALQWLVRMVRQRLDHGLSTALGASPGGPAASGGLPGGPGEGLLQWWLARMGRASEGHQPAQPTVRSRVAEREGGDARFAGLVGEASERFEVPEPLVREVIRAESDFDPEAVSPAGAQGLMQLMPETAQELGVEDPFDPRQNIMGGTRYLRLLLDRYDGDRDLALAAYNWGMGNLERSPGSLPEETVRYVSGIREGLDDASA